MNINKTKFALLATFALSMGVAFGILHGCSLLNAPPKEIHAVVVPVEKPAPAALKKGDRVIIKACLFHEAVGVILEVNPLYFDDSKVLFIGESGKHVTVLHVPTSLLKRND
jgi:hypothetical protein